jgi:predicted cupin superfamily sugar epimerase
MITPKQIIGWLGLQPNSVEGGYFAGTYQSVAKAPGSSHKQLSKSNTRALCSAIYYFLEPDICSIMHRVSTDMIYHFYSGDPVEMLLLYPPTAANRYEICLFSNDIAAGAYPMKVIPGGTWLGSRLTPGGAYALMGVTMAPGFDPQDYAIGQRRDLIKEYPEQVSLITALTRDPEKLSSNTPPNAAVPGDKSNGIGLRMGSQQEAFLCLSVCLTGFERTGLLGTGMLAEYYKRVTSDLVEQDLQNLWSIAMQLDGLAKSGKDNGFLQNEIKRLLMDDDRLGAVAKNIIKLWYRGDWPDSAARFGAAYTSAQSYQEGLLWKAMSTHPSGAKQPGFGSWSVPPRKVNT